MLKVPTPPRFWFAEEISAFDIYKHGAEKILAYRATPFQEVWVIQGGPYGKALIIDRKWQACTGDEFIYHETLVHLPFAIHGHPERVLILGGGDGGALREALRWRSIQRASVVEIDTEVVELSDLYLPEISQGAFEDPRASVNFSDAREFLEQNRSTWDVIVCDLTDPAPGSPSALLYDWEFYELCRNRLSLNGLLVTQAGEASPVILDASSNSTDFDDEGFPFVTPISVPVPSFGSPVAFILGSSIPIPPNPKPDGTDQLLARQVMGELQFFDGSAMLALLQTPKYLRASASFEKHLAHA